MRTAYLHAASNDDDDDCVPSQTASRTLPSPLSVDCTVMPRTYGDHVLDDDYDVEARRLYEWTQNLSVDD